MHRKLLTAAAVAALAHPAIASAQATPEPIDDTEVVTLTEWEYDPLYAEGWSAEQFIDDMAVYGPTGEEIGDVENLVVGPDGNILSVIAEIGGFIDIGDTHVNVPWDRIEFTQAGDGIIIPVTQETIEDFSLYPDDAPTASEVASDIEAVDDDVEPLGRAWKATELMDDYVRLEGDVNYGYVNDLIFGEGGALQAVVVTPDVGYGVGGYYAYPYYGYGYGFDPGLDYYGLPYAQDEVAGLEPFDYDAFE
ncbi:PRC-barrel domain-containing protein [Arenibaculum sp.]|jgi:sporulation protein YlmC with PRC-barrel domain|uniref:PRC-barrel domain-containing protein n=1 Tax=Arenibaculum sp. TaxID=2865862 RepID=UPI002E0DC16B|nr:PRC-barrel domain-containing protein [Arenibaculum sp.]